jgi:hypothetical protein
LDYRLFQRYFEFLPRWSDSKLIFNITKVLHRRLKQFPNSHQGQNNLTDW